MLPLKKAFLEAFMMGCRPLFKAYHECRA